GPGSASPGTRRPRDRKPPCVGSGDAGPRRLPLAHVRPPERQRARLHPVDRRDRGAPRRRGLRAPRVSRGLTSAHRPGRRRAGM
ncbi:MAG: hypothetical protein AVDCRST_MAG53-3519, partial [uncultured Solirubrobacteraceae bacterium]